MSGRFMIYGATGYTGKLVSKTAKEKGFSPLLAGRDGVKLKSVAEPLGFDYQPIELDDADGLDAGLSQVDAVLHIAGPFSQTSEPMVDACLRTGTHYLDITGEIDVFEACAARSGEAMEKGVMLMPGVGFDVVPSDCLAAHMKKRLPDARELTLAIAGLNSVSQGTAKTGVESIGEGTKVRRGGRIIALDRPLEEKIDFGSGARDAISVSWGDVATAYHSTHIPDITVFFEATKQMRQLAGLGPLMRFILSSGPGQAFLKRQIEKGPEGPSDEERAKAQATLIGIASDSAGNTLRSRLTTPEGYTLTAFTSLEIARRVVEGAAEPGYQTPSLVFGPDFICGFDGCVREDLNA